MDAFALNVLVVTPEQAQGVALTGALRAKGLSARASEPGGLGETADLKLADLAIVDGRAGSEAVRRVASVVEYVIVLGDAASSAEVLGALRAGASDFLPRDGGRDKTGGAALDEAIARFLERREPLVAFIEIEEKGESRPVRVRGPVFSIGRDPANELCLDSAVVSRFHAKVLRRGAGFALVDCGSRHGTFVNGARAEDTPLLDGAKIRLGNPGSPVVTFRTGPPGAEAVSKASVTARPFTDTSQEMRDIASLVDTFLKLNGDLVLDDLLGIVVARSIELANAERGMILLAEDADGKPRGEDRVDEAPGAVAPGGLRVAIARTSAGVPIDDEGLQFSQKIPEEVLATGKGAIVEDLHIPEEKAAHPSTIELGVRSAMCVPLRARRPGDASAPPKVLGVLYVDSTDRSRPFTPGLLRALESLASEAAQAIFSSRLYAESLAKREMDAEMRIARSIQQNILPPSSFENAGVEVHGTSRSARDVGGDLLDYHPFDDGRVNVVVGDVSGKGIPAAILSSMLDGLCYGLGAQGGVEFDLGKVAGDVNRYLVGKSGFARFVSVFFGTLGTDGRILYVNAGHNPPLRVTPSGKVDLLRTGGMIMGMFEEAVFQTGELRLEPGDMLVLYSDGLTDSRSKAGERFGLDRLKETAILERRRGARGAHDAILAAVQAFTGGAPLIDDLTLLMLRKK